MSKNKILAFLMAGLFASTRLFSVVPSVQFHKPDIPRFLQSMEFQTVQMQVFPREVTGMVPDLFSDLSWNPAYLVQLSKRTAYLDFHAFESLPLFATQGTGIQYVITRNMTTDVVSPSWYMQTSVYSVQTAPLYNFGMMLPVSARLKIGIFNRTVFDYGPFLQGYSGWYTDYRAYDESKTGGSYLNTQRLEVDNNQQTVLGNQVEVVIGYRLSEKLDLGLRAGHMVYDRHGDLLNDRWANYPHSSFANLQDESLKIRGHHVEAGLGLLFRPDSTTRVGFYCGLTTGDGSEKSASQDTTRTWSELDVDPRYYDKNYSFLKSDQSFTEDGSRPELALTFEKQLSGKWMLRSFVSASWSNVNVTGNVAANDTTAVDRKFDYYDSNDYNVHFRKQEGHGSRGSSLTGEGTEESCLWKGLISFAYIPNGCWSLFSGIHVQYYTYRQDFSERSDYKTHRWDEYSIYKSETYRDTYSFKKDYSMKSEYDRWSLYLPVGFRIKVVQGFSVLLGTGVAFSIDDENASGELLYPTKITKKWKNGNLIVDDEETDRYELFRSDPAKVLNRQWGRYFGLAYHHPCGAKVYLKCADNFSQMTNWAFGFEMNW